MKSTMLRNIIAITTAYILYQPFLAKGFTFQLFLFLPWFAAVYSIVLLRRIHRKKREIAIIMSEVFSELHVATRRSERTFSQAMISIESLHTQLQDNQMEWRDIDFGIGASKAVDITKP